MLRMREKSPAAPPELQQGQSLRALESRELPGQVSFLPAISCLQSAEPAWARVSPAQRLSLAAAGAQRAEIVGRGWAGGVRARQAATP